MNIDAIVNTVGNNVERVYQSVPDDDMANLLLPRPSTRNERNVRIHPEKPSAVAGHVTSVFMVRRLPLPVSFPRFLRKISLRDQKLFSQTLRVKIRMCCVLWQSSLTLQLPRRISILRQILSCIHQQRMHGTNPSG